MNTIAYARKPFTPKPSGKWLKKDEGYNRFYVYILKLEKGYLYVGQTRELKERILEHKEGMTPSTAGEHPKLRYFEILPTREDAQIREHEIKALLSSNRREVVRMITEFQSLISEVDKN